MEKIYVCHKCGKEYKESEIKDEQYSKMWGDDVCIELDDNWEFCGTPLIEKERYKRIIKVFSPKEK